MGYAWMLATAVAAVLGSCLFNALVRLVWRPRAIARRLRRRGVRGPEYELVVGNLDDIKRLWSAGAGVVLDVASHDFLPITQPQFRKWIRLYGFSWTMFLLSTHPEWQEKLREEVRRECGKDQVPTHDMLNKLKLVNMFLLETLRLYSPIPLIRRRTRSGVELDGITVPEGAILTIPITMIYRDKEVWGEDGDEFDLMRFDNSTGTTKTSRHLNAPLSLSMGPRACIGQNFAMIEVRAAVAVILQRFALSLSPKYVHTPTDVITVRPKYGLPMIVRSVHV